METPLLADVYGSATLIPSADCFQNYQASHRRRSYERLALRRASSNTLDKYKSPVLAGLKER